MKLELTKKQYRRLLDMVYIGNWVLNSTRGEDRIPDYDEVESLLFSKARDEGMGILAEVYDGEVVPSRAFAEGGIHEAIMDYEDSVFSTSWPRIWHGAIWTTSPSMTVTVRSSTPASCLYRRI
ncbi:MAG: hypothetical protein ACLSAF_11800 [Intestinimonas sp.]